MQKKVKADRKVQEKFAFTNTDQVLIAIKKDFCVIKELEGIYQLETINDMHEENVSDHTLLVVKNLSDNEYFQELNNEDKLIVKLSAYLHDIGKGPANKWKSGKQPTYPDHPVDSLKMLTRILTEEIENISKSDIKKICKLVAYHDLLGDIVGRGRSKDELFNIIQNENELNMLAALSIADIQAINAQWCDSLKVSLPGLIEDVKEYLE